mmetsp:Transcript_8996/g.23458  ORF Transcript_8996/g.23458 Transcript_8996/m.23458 type:complete len:499 (+) Transcript_8996:87-1583(+)
MPFPPLPFPRVRLPDIAGRRGRLPQSVPPDQRLPEDENEEEEEDTFLRGRSKLYQRRKEIEAEYKKEFELLKGAPRRMTLREAAPHDGLQGPTLLNQRAHARPEKVERPEKFERPEKQEKLERPERPEKQEMQDRPKSKERQAHPPPIPPIPRSLSEDSEDLPSKGGSQSPAPEAPVLQPSQRPESWRRQPSVGRAPSADGEKLDAPPSPKGFRKRAESLRQREEQMRKKARREELLREERRRADQAREEERQRDEQKRAEVQRVQQEEEEDWEHNIRQRFADEQRQQRLRAAQEMESEGARDPQAMADAEARRRAEHQRHQAERLRRDWQRDADRQRREEAERSRREAQQHEAPSPPQGPRRRRTHCASPPDPEERRAGHGGAGVNARPFDNVNSDPPPQWHQTAKSAAYMRRTMNRSTSLPALNQKRPAPEEVRRLAEAAGMEQLRALRNLPKRERQKGFKDLLRAWHPDKNPDNHEVATAVFQRLQSERCSILGP